MPSTALRADARTRYSNYMTVAEIDAWVAEKRHHVMYKDDSKVD